jgi:hypothetical protein
MMMRFLKAVLVGTLYGASIPFYLTALMGIGLMVWPGNAHSTLVGIFTIMVAPIFIVFPIVLAASILLGVPTVFVLKRIGHESDEIYTLLGALAGAAIPILGGLAIGGQMLWQFVLLCGPGMLGGAATARAWSRLRPEMSKG